MSSEPTVFLSAGEPSGDRYAGRLAREIRERSPGVRLLGLGGRRMAKAGVERLAGLDRLAVMGVVEVARRLPSLLRLRRRARARLVRDDVDLLVAVNYPGFNVPLCRFASGRGVPVLYYAPPQVWAWRPGRARQLADSSDLVCTILPFAGKAFARSGADVEFVGHPLLDEVDAVGGSGPAGEAAPSSTPDTPRLGLFPGSREQEVRALAPPMADAARRLRETRPDLEVGVARVPDVPEDAYGPLRGAEDCPAEELARRSTAALAASGTVTLELALHGTPMAVAYRTDPVTFGLARRLVSVERIALVNLIHGSELVPELLQGRATGEELAAAVSPLLGSGRERRRILRGLRTVRGRLGRPGVAARVADRCLGLVERRRPAA